jgi:hypothetical protein
MGHKQRNIRFLATLFIGILTMSMIGLKENDSDYQRAISIAEKNFSSFKIKRNGYKLIKIENDVVKNSETWKLTYLSKSCLSKEGLRNCKGGEAFITVNIKTEKAAINWGE